MHVCTEATVMFFGVMSVFYFYLCIYFSYLAFQQWHIYVYCVCFTVDHMHIEEYIEEDEEPPLLLCSHPPCGTSHHMHLF